MKNDTMEKLFKKHYNEAKLYVFSLCRNEHLAEDIVSESFYKAFSTIDEEKDGFKFWLFRVCRNCYFDYLRKNKRIVELNEDITSSDSDLAATVIQQEEYRALYHAISLLKQNYQEVVRLYYFNGMSVLEIASITEQSVENVKVILFRARAKLKEILEVKNEF
ncbi:MAG: sigma-70 family RNA polymerase sigma factor [Clostridia bacterium]